MLLKPVLVYIQVAYLKIKKATAVEIKTSRGAAVNPLLVVRFSAVSKMLFKNLILIILLLIFFF